MLSTLLFTGLIYEGASTTAPACDMTGLSTQIALTIGTSGNMGLIQPCNAMSAHLTSIFDADGNILSAPDMDILCPCLGGLGQDFADTNLNCDIVMGVNAMKLYDSCVLLNGGGGGGGDVNCASDEAVDCMTNCAGCAVLPDDPVACPMAECDTCDMYLSCLGGPGDVDCDSDEAKDCVDNCGGCAIDEDDPDLCPETCDACAMFGICLGGGGGLGGGSGADETDEPTAEPTASPTMSPTVEDGTPTDPPTDEPETLCNVDTLAGAMVQAFVQQLLAPDKIVPCQQTGEHLRDITDGAGGLTGMPDYPLICSCLTGFTNDWAAANLNCEVGAGISAVDVHGECLAGVHDPASAPPTASPTATPTDAPTAEPTQTPVAAPTEPQDYSVTWGVRLCCMTKDKCEATGGSLKTALHTISAVTTECTAVSSADRRRNTGETWDVQYTMEVDSEEDATTLKDKLDATTTQDVIKSQIEDDTESTVSQFVAETPRVVAEPRKGDDDDDDSGLGTPAIIGIVAGLGVVGAALGFLCYKNAQKLSEPDELSTRLSNGGFSSVAQTDVENGAGMTVM